MPEDRRVLLAELLVVGSASLVLISGVDDNCYRFFARAAPQLKLAAALRITSLILCAILCLAFGQKSRTARTATPWRIVAVAAVSWLCGSVVALFVFHVWTPSLPSWIDLASFLGTGLLAEEFLFRGAVFALAQKLFGTAGRLPVAAIGISAVLFGLQHFGYHGWHFTGPALTQVSYTIAFGILLGLLRSSSDGLSVPTAVHFLNNLLTVIYRNTGN